MAEIAIVIAIERRGFFTEKWIGVFPNDVAEIIDPGQVRCLKIGATRPIHATTNDISPGLNGGDGTKKAAWIRIGVLVSEHPGLSETEVCKST